jgi:hypothetical protein
MSACGECTACCTVMAVEEIRKPPGTKCVHLDDGCVGCSIYEMRPESCRGFQCLWLQTQGTHVEWPKKMRPDRCGVMFAATTRDDTVAAHCQSELALDAHPARGYTKNMLRNGMRVIRVVGDKRTLIARVKV